MGGREGTTGARPAAVAGLFYPAEAGALARAVDDAVAGVPAPSAVEAPKALIVPHAGYVYSGEVAARAYARLAPLAGTVTRVVILGPAHRVPVRGLALPGASAFATPLGEVAVDADAVEAIAGLPQVVVSPAAHAHEHSLEVQLPFLQRTLPGAAVVPLVVGEASADEVAEVLERLWGGPETRILISSDLSHFHRYEDAQAIDAATVRSILALAPELDHEQACGATPIAGLLEVARRRRLVPQLLDLCNSGDTAGDKRRVVGYASLAFFEDDAPAAGARDAHGRTLLDIARGAIREALGAGERHEARDAWLDAPGATFVTLRQRGELRGCIGSLVPRRALREDVAANACAAALSDPRFPPLCADEVHHTEIEVSLLSTPEPVAFECADDLFARITPGVDGVVLAAEGRRATFLPQVWEDLPSHELFFAYLLRKAGLPDDFPLERCEIERYTVQKWTERGLGLSR